MSSPSRLLCPLLAGVLAAALAAGPARADDAPKPGTRLIDVPRGEGIRVTRPVPPLALTIGGISVGFAAAGIATGALALSQRSDTLGVATGVLLGAAFLGAGVTIGLYVERPTVEVSVPVPGPEAARLRLELGMAGAHAGAAGAWISGSL